MVATARGRSSEDRSSATKRPRDSATRLPGRAPKNPCDGESEIVRVGDVGESIGPDLMYRGAPQSESVVQGSPPDVDGPGLIDPIPDSGLVVDDDSFTDKSELAKQLSSLTPQQFRVLQMLSEGKLNKQIAYELNVGETTVKAHVSAILRKLKVYSRTQAVIKAQSIEFASVFRAEDDHA